MPIILTSRDRDQYLCMNVFNYDYVTAADTQKTAAQSSRRTPLSASEIDWNEEDEVSYPYYEVCQACKKALNSTGFIQKLKSTTQTSRNMKNTKPHFFKKQMAS